MTIGSDDNRDSRISKALNTSRLVESLLHAQHPHTTITPRSDAKRPITFIVEVVGEGGPEEAKGPLLGERAGLAKHDGNGGVANLVSGEQVGQPATRDVFVFEHRRVPLLDHHRGARVGGEGGQLTGQRALWRSWLRVSMRVSTAERRAIINTRIASTLPSRDFGKPVAVPDRAARAAATASTGSDLPCRCRVWRFGRSTSTTATPARVRYRDRPTP